MFSLFGGSAKSGSQRLADDIARKQAAHRNLPFSGRMSIGAAVQKAAASEPAQIKTPTMLSRGADAAGREQAQRDAALVGHHVVKRGQRIVIKAALPAGLTDGAFLTLDLLLKRYEAAGRAPVRLLAEDIATSIGIKVEAARAALDELRGAGLLIDVRNDALGDRKIMPSATALGQ